MRFRLSTAEINRRAQLHTRFQWGELRPDEYRRLLDQGSLYNRFVQWLYDRKEKRIKDGGKEDEEAGPMW